MEVVGAEVWMTSLVGQWFVVLQLLHLQILYLGQHVPPGEVPPFLKMIHPQGRGQGRQR